MDYKLFTNTKILYILMIALGIFLRIINIVSEQIWADEATSMFIANASYDEFWRLIINDIHPPLYYLILKGWIYIFGFSIFSCRLLSVVFSIVTIPILFLIGKEMKSEKMGLIVVFIFSISPFSIYYANEIRSYSLLQFLFTGDLYFAIKCLRAPNNHKNYLIFGIIGVFLIYTHYMGVIYFGILLIGVFFFNRKERDTIKKCTISISIVIISYIPWLPYAINDLFEGPQGYAGGQLNLIYLLYWSFYYFIGPVPSNIDDPYILNIIVLTSIINIPSIFILIISFIGFCYSYRNNNYNDLRNLRYFFILIVSLLYGITIILGFILEDTFTAKNLIGGLSIIYLFQSLGLYYLFFDKEAKFSKMHKNFLKVINTKLLHKMINIILIALLINSIIIYPIFRAIYLQKPDWDGCIKKLKKEFKNGDIVIMGYKGGGFTYTMEYYSNVNNFDLEDNFYELNYNENDIEEFFTDITKENITRIWIVNYWHNIRDPNNNTEKMLVDEYNLEKIEEYYFRLDISLVIYELP